LVGNEEEVGKKLFKYLLLESLKDEGEMRSI
jgi:hypothetical protein